MGHSDRLSFNGHCAHCGGKHHATCTPCETQTPLRNHYFFGKLMDVPDFDVEQFYVVEKFKRHHARLHGSGVVCGLDVAQHPNPACRDRYVVVGPGSALDCCGNEIVVLDPETIDLLGFPAVQALIDATKSNPAVASPSAMLQLCIRYRECPTEDVPVLYDECGCDDTRCAPNRILETYDFDVIVGTTPPPSIPNAPALDWQSTLALAGAQALAVHRPTLRFYAAADIQPTGGLIQQYHLATLAPLAPRTFATRVLATALDIDGKRLYAAVAGAAATDAAQLHTLDTTSASAYSTGATQPVDIPNSASATDVQLVLLPAGLASLAVTSGATPTSLQVWDTTATPAPMAGRLATATSALIGATLGTDGRLYAAAPSGSIATFDATVAGLDPQSIPVAATDVVAFGLARSTGPDALVWLEGSGKALKQARLDGTNVVGVTLADTPAALLLAPGGRTAFVSTRSAAGESVQAVDLFRLAGGTSPVLGPALAIGAAASDGSVGIGRRLMALDDRLYASYLDGVAVLDVLAGDCGAALGPHACPQCATTDCIVLATLVGWQPGFALTDVAVPASDPMADSAAKIARIDDLLGRSVVPSVADLAAAVRCLLERGTGGTGLQGPPGGTGPQGPAGPDGPAGPGIDAVTAHFVPCDQPGSATLAGSALDLVIPKGCDGKDGAAGADGGDGDGLDWNLPHICDISWKHGGKLSLQPPTTNSGGTLSLIIAFDTPVVGADLGPMSIQFQVRMNDPTFGALLLHWCDVNLDVQGAITPGRLETACSTKSTFLPGVDSSGMATAVLIRTPNLVKVVEAQREDALARVVVQGDFVRGLHKKTQQLRALDADHIPKLDPPSPPGAPQPGVTPQWLQPGDGRFSGDGIEGGTFESIFHVVP